MLMPVEIKIAIKLHTLLVPMCINPLTSAMSMSMNALVEQYTIPLLARPVVSSRVITIRVAVAVLIIMIRAVEALVITIRAAAALEIMCRAAAALVIMAQAAVQAILARLVAVQAQRLSFLSPVLLQPKDNPSLAEML